MFSSTIQNFVAILMVGAAVALVIAIRKYMATQSERRMLGMLERIGLDPAIATSGDTGSIMKEVRQRCRSCSSEDVCERWLSGDKGGTNDFCPNREVFESIRKSLGTTT